MYYVCLDSEGSVYGDWQKIANKKGYETLAKAARVARDECTEHVGFRSKLYVISALGDEDRDRDFVSQGAVSRRYQVLFGEVWELDVWDGSLKRSVRKDVPKKRREIKVAGGPLRPGTKVVIKDSGEKGTIAGHGLMPMFHYHLEEKPGDFAYLPSELTVVRGKKAAAAQALKGA